jgi:ABC-type bacteriocin/lantibiotic exporter with double-glycine peptidase domain
VVRLETASSGFQRCSGRVNSDLRRLLGYIAPYWRRLVLVLVLSLVGTGLSLVLPYLTRVLIDRALIGRDTGALVRVVLAFAALTVASFALNVVSGLRYTRVSADILFDMRLALFRHLQRLSPRFYARMPLGQIASRINSDIGEIQRVAAEVALSWIGSVVFLVGAVAILIALDPLLFAVSIAVLPLSLFALVRYRRRLEDSIAVVRDRSAGIGTFLIDALQGMRLVVTHNAQEREVARFRERNDAFIDALMRMRRLTYLSGGAPGLLLALGSGAVFLVGGWRVIDGTITIGTLVAFVAYQMRLLGPVQSLMGLYASVATARVSLRRVHEILDTPPDVTESDRATALPSARGNVVLDDVTFTFDRGRSRSIAVRRCSTARASRFLPARAWRSLARAAAGSPRSPTSSSGSSTPPRAEFFSMATTCGTFASPTFDATSSSWSRTRSSSTPRWPRTSGTLGRTPRRPMWPQPLAPPASRRWSTGCRWGSTRRLASADARSPPVSASASR